MFRTLFHLLIRNSVMFQEAKISDRNHETGQTGKKAHSRVGDT